MMTASLFHEALWTLALLRRDELVAEGILAADDEAMWEKFNADRFGWAMMNPAQSERLWRAIWRHDPRTAEQRNNVVDLPQRRSSRG